MSATTSASEIKEDPAFLMCAVCAFSGLVIGLCEIYRNALFAIEDVAEFWCCWPSSDVRMRNMARDLAI